MTKTVNMVDTIPFVDSAIMQEVGDPVNKVFLLIEFRTKIPIIIPSQHTNGATLDSSGATMRPVSGVFPLAAGCGDLIDTGRAAPGAVAGRGRDPVERCYFL